MSSTKRTTVNSVVATRRLGQLERHFTKAAPSHPLEHYHVDTTHRHQFNVTNFLPRAAEIERAALAIYHTSSNGKTIQRNYGDFAERAASLSYYLREKQVKRVAILCPNTPCYLESMFAISGAGIAQAGVNYRLQKSEVQYCITFADCDYVIVDEEYVSLLDGLDPSIGVLVDRDYVDESGKPVGPFEDAIKEGREINKQYGNEGWNGLCIDNFPEDDPFFYAFTSGTTGKPKAVEYTQRGMYISALGTVIEANLNCQDPLGHNRCHYLWTLPLFHAAGWTMPYAVTAIRGTHYTLRKINYPLIWDLFKKHRITHMNAAPTVNTILCNDPAAERLEYPVRVTVAASPPSATLFERMVSLNLMPIHVYGLTETFGPFARGYVLPEWHAEGNEKYQKMARQGYGYVTSKRARVVRPNGIDEVAYDGKEIGEIIVNGNMCMRGYYKDPEATAKAFQHGWFHSGDLAVKHPDGSIQILDRGKDIIISGGENISSVAVENAIMRHPSVLEVAVVGVPDDQYGEKPKAYITLKSGKKDFDPKEMIQFLRSHLGGYQIPRLYEVIDELPKTSTGKVRKNVLRDEAKKQAAAANGKQLAA